MKTQICVNNRKIDFKENIEYESLDFYIKLAEKYGPLYCRRFFPSFYVQLRNNEDFLSHVTHYIIMGDNKYNARLGSLENYRRVRALYAVKNYVCNMFSNKNKFHNTLLSSEDDTYEFIPNKELQASYKTNKQYERIENKEFLDNLIKHTNLTDKQKQCIEMYFLENHTMDGISKELGCSTSWVNSNIKSAIFELQLASGVIPTENIDS